MMPSNRIPRPSETAFGTIDGRGSQTAASRSERYRSEHAAEQSEMKAVVARIEEELRTGLLLRQQIVRRIRSLQLEKGSPTDALIRTRLIATLREAKEVSQGAQQLLWSFRGEDGQQPS